MKKTRIAFLLVLTFTMFLLTSCGTKTFEFENISRIELTNGTNGEMVEITDANQIQTLIQLFSENEFDKGKSASDSTGWSYRIKFYQDEKVMVDIFVLSSDTSIVYSGYFYEIKNGTLDITCFDDMINLNK